MPVEGPVQVLEQRVTRPGHLFHTVQHGTPPDLVSGVGLAKELHAGLDRLRRLWHADNPEPSYCFRGQHSPGALKELPKASAP